MDSVRRYADKRQTELKEMIQTYKSEFNAIISDFKAQQTQANAAIKVFKQQNEEFDQKVKSLENNISTVNNIENQISHNSKLLNELNEMTVNIEENLERLHKESGIVNSLTAR